MKTTQRFLLVGGAILFGVGLTQCEVNTSETADMTLPPEFDLAEVIPPDMAVPPDLSVQNPTLSAVVAARGPAAGGTAIVLTGTNFKPGASVSIGGLAATGVVVVSATTINATTPASTSYGAVDIVVNNKDGSMPATLTKGFTYFLGTFALAAGADIATGLTNPRSISIVDLQGQGFPSIFTAVGNSIALLPNTTNGATPNMPTFGTPVVTGTGQAGSFQTAIGDMNADGTPDVVVTNFANNNASVMVRVGANTTPNLITSVTGGFNLPSFVAVADFDADGKQDIAVANQGGGLSVLAGSNDGKTFTAVAGSPFAMGTNYTPYGLAVGDFDGDKRPDLVIGNVFAGGNLRVLLSKSTGFSLQANLVSGNGPNVIGVGDFTGDGKLDIVAVNRAGGSVSMFKGDGAGGFSKVGADVAVGTGPEAIAVGDLNMDGFLDVVVPNYGSSNLHYLLGNGDGTFKTPVMINTGIQSNGVGIADFNKDGKPDVVITNGPGANVQVLRNTST